MDVVEVHAGKSPLKDGDVEAATEERHDHRIARDDVREVAEIVTLDQPDVLATVVEADRRDGRRRRSAVGLDVEIDAGFTESVIGPPRLSCAEAACEEL